MGFGGLVDHLIHRQGDKITKHNVHDRTHPGDGCANAQPRDTRFGDG